jgi:hypothetical protein
MEQIPRKEDKIHFGIPGNLEDLAKGVDAVLSADGVFLGVADVVIGSEEDTEAADGISESEERREEGREASA